MSLEDLLPAYLGRQRWFAGEEPEKVVVVEDDEVVPGLRWLLVDADGARYQLVVGFRPLDDQPEYLHGHDDVMIGVIDDSIAFDATIDPEYAKALLAKVAPDQEAVHVRPIGVEQSNTSLIVDDRLVLKLFRRLQDGPNPDVEVTEELGKVGFLQVAAPLATWTFEGSHLAVVQPYLAGGSEGWALALGSLRDLYARADEGEGDPAAAGGDFAGEACRLGEITGRMHVALAEAFGVHPGDPAQWADMARSQLQRLQPGDADEGAAAAFIDGLAALDPAAAGASIRAHGDYHLGQVLRTDAGWFVLDFEGEPARPLAERRLPTSPLKDVGGMLRSFHYATRVAMSERDPLSLEDLAGPAEAWEARNRDAFLGGYFEVEGIERLLPASEEARQAVVAAFELDKAVYEVLYERAHRPDWVDIPLAAIRRLLAG
jgi:maltokinase